MEELADLRRQRAVAFDAFKVLAEKDVLDPAELTDFADKEKAIRAFDERIVRARQALELAAASAVPVAGQNATVAATLETDPYVKTRSLVLGGAIRMLIAGDGNLYTARQVAQEKYGESHPVTRALVTSVGASGGLIVPPDYVNEVIELLRAKAVVRASNSSRDPDAPRHDDTARPGFGGVGGLRRRRCEDRRFAADAERHRGQLQEADRTGARQQ